jgi:NADPH2:quinone reductase
VAGTVVGAPSGRPGVELGARVAGVVPYGGAAERVVVPVSAVFPLPERTSYDEGAALPMNYLTALFALAERGHVREGETVLVHGAAGGVEVVLVEGFKEAVADLTGGRGVDVVLDVVGGDVFTDSLRCLTEQGRLLVVGFASGRGIPEVKVNRLLLNNVDVRGVGWGGFAMTKPSYMRGQWDLLLPMIESGVVRPPIGATYDLDGFGRALQDMADRRALGKSVVHVR